MKLNHCHVNAVDAETCAAFYEMHLGFRRLYNVSPEEGRKIVFIEGSDGEILGIEENSDETPKWFHIGFRFDSRDEFDRTIEALMSSHVEFAEGEQSREHYASRVIIDPGGNHVQLFWEKAI